jgi:hypothetical protein
VEVHKVAAADEIRLGVLERARAAAAEVAFPDPMLHDRRREKGFQGPLEAPWQRRCPVCGGPLPTGCRSDRVYCSKRCLQRVWEDTPDRKAAKVERNRRQRRLKKGASRG